MSIVPEERLERILLTVEKPGRYTGQEWNAVVKDWDAVGVRLALAYPDLYEIGMSNMGLAILYDLVNRRPDMLAERAYTPWPDMAAALRRAMSAQRMISASRRPASRSEPRSNVSTSVGPGRFMKRCCRVVIAVAPTTATESRPLWKPSAAAV